MPFEEALIQSAGGNFLAVLSAFLVVSLVGIFVWFMKTVMDSNTAFNAEILKKMDQIVEGMKEYRTSTCDELAKHDEQAKIILATQQETLTTLKNRPCVANGVK